MATEGSEQVMPVSTIKMTAFVLFVRVEDARRAFSLVGNLLYRLYSRGKLLIGSRKLSVASSISSRLFRRTVASACTRLGSSWRGPMSIQARDG